MVKKKAFNGCNSNAEYTGQGRASGYLVTEKGVAIEAMQLKTKE